MYSCGPFHRDEQRQDVQLKHTYCSSVQIQNVARKTCQKQWTIGRGGERGSEIFVLIVQHDDDDDDYLIIRIRGACGVMVIVIGIGHSNTSSNPGLIAFHIALIPLGKV